MTKIKEYALVILGFISLLLFSWAQILKRKSASKEAEVNKEKMKAQSRISKVLAESESKAKQKVKNVKNLVKLRGYFTNK